MTRRQILGSLAGAAFAQGAERPNVVLILSDDHTQRDLGVSGNPVVKTPNLDRFARQGMRFTRAFTAAPQCVPSRTGYLTGRSPVAARMGRFNSPLPREVKVFPEYLRAAGYYTGVCRRSYHLDGAPGAAGTDTNAIYERHALRTFHERMDFVDRTAGPRTKTPEILDQFFAKVPAGKPFFLWVNFNDPHHPWDKLGTHDSKEVPVPAHMPDLPGVREDIARHYDEISRMDEEFQWVLDALAKRGVEQNTIVIFAGDNGQALPHGKGSLYDSGLNVPFLVRWPGKVSAGRVSAELVSGEDVGPTVLEAVGLPVPKDMSGKSFLGHLRGAAAGPREYIFGARLHHGNAPFTETTRASTFDLSRCVRSKRYKLIYNCTPQMEYSPVDSARDPGWTQIVEAHKAGKLSAQHEQAYFGKRRVIELYDLEKDPAELENLAGRPELAKIERELKVVLAEKMILDYDFLPPPIND
jgi:arylsulfatase A-like enzyme